jgi:ferric-dicitrate binding protein FerR (iron transport regulator)
MRKPGQDGQDDGQADAMDDRAAHRIAALLRADAMGAIDEEEDHARWTRLLRSAHRSDEERGRAPAGRRRWVPLTVAAAALAIAGGSIAYRAFAPRSLTFRIDGRDPQDAQLSSGAGETRDIDFSDGSRIVLRPSGRIRVTETTARGAALILEHGELEVSVRHRPATRWRLSVGPYTVKVTGTRFNVSWAPDSGDFKMDMLDGAVTVEGPGVTAPVTVVGGHQFRATDRGTTPLAPAAPQPESTGNGDAESAPRVSRDDLRRTEPGSLRGASRSARLDRGSCRWDELVSSGRFDPLLAEARAMGIDRALADCPASSLFAMADAARYRSDFDLSRRALLAIRRRSPPDAGKAAFFLGRVEEARGNYELALRWYSEAAEARQGAGFVSEARAAKTRVAKRVPAHAAP